MPARRGQRRLGRTGAAPSECRPHRRAEVPRQIVGLIEAPLPGAPRMQGYGNDGVGLGQPFDACLCHQPRERPRQQPPLFVLERLDDSAQRAVVSTGASRHE
jgi:hypothetical protein